MDYYTYPRLNPLFLCCIGIEVFVLVFVYLYLYVFFIVDSGEVDYYTHLPPLLLNGRLLHRDITALFRIRIHHHHHCHHHHHHRHHHNSSSSSQSIIHLDITALFHNYHNILFDAVANSSSKPFPNLKLFSNGSTLSL